VTPEERARYEDVVAVALAKYGNLHRGMGESLARDGADVAIDALERAGVVLHLPDEEPTAGPAPATERERALRQNVEVLTTYPIEEWRDRLVPVPPIEKGLTD